MAPRDTCLPVFNCTHSLIRLCSGKLHNFFFTINFIETVKLIKEKFTPLNEYTSYFLREETMAYLLSEVLVPAIVPGHRRCSTHSWWKTSHTS